MASTVALEVPTLMVGVWPANADLSAEPSPGQPTYQFAAVDLETPGTGVPTEAGAALNLASAGFPAIGVLQDNPPKGVAGAVMLLGISKVKLGTGGCALTDLLMADGSGGMVVATTGNHAIAKPLRAGSAGDIIPAFVKSYGKV